MHEHTHTLVRMYTLKAPFKKWYLSAGHFLTITEICHWLVFIHTYKVKDMKEEQENVQTQRKDELIPNTNINMFT